MLLFWYCFDDYLAGLFHNPELGHVPIWVVFVAMLVLSPFLPRSKGD